MKIEFNNQQDKDFFTALLDNFIAMSEIDEVEQNFINRLYESIQVTEQESISKV